MIFLSSGYAWPRKPMNKQTYCFLDSFRSDGYARNLILVLSLSNPLLKKIIWNLVCFAINKSSSCRLIYSGWAAGWLRHHARRGGASRQCGGSLGSARRELMANRYPSTEYPDFGMKRWGYKESRSKSQ